MQHISEADFQQAVIELARACGWKVAHFHDSRRQVGGKLVGDIDAKGWPDLVLARRDVVLFRELKSSKGKVTTDQWDWLVALADGGEDVLIWAPDNWDLIEKTLS